MKVNYCSVNKLVEYLGQNKELRAKLQYNTAQFKLLIRTEF